MAVSAINYLPPFANSLIMHVLTNAEKLIPLRDAASLAESRRLAGMRMVTGTTSPSTRYERISVSPASCSIKSEYVIASHAFKPQYKCINYTPTWEQRKLGELEKDATLYMGRGRVISAKDMSNTPGTFPVYSSSALDNGRMGAYGKYMFNQELITWSIDGGGAVFYRRKHRFSVTNVSGYIAVNPEKINCKFLAYAMSLAHSRIKFDYTVKAHPSVIRSLYTMGIPISLQEQQVIGSFFSRLDNLITLHQRKRQWLKWLDEGGEGTHHDIDILVFKFADDMKISVLCGVHACMTKSLGHTGNRYAGKQQQRGMGVP